MRNSTELGQFTSVKIICPVVEGAEKKKRGVQDFSVGGGVGGWGNVQKEGL